MSDRDDPNGGECRHGRLRRITQVNALFECLDCGELLGAQPEGSVVERKATRGGRDTEAEPAERFDFAAIVQSETNAAYAAARNWFNANITNGASEFDKLVKEKLQIEYESRRIDWAMTLPPGLRKFALEKNGDVPRACEHPSKDLGVRVETSWDEARVTLRCRRCSVDVLTKMARFAPVGDDAMIWCVGKCGRSIDPARNAGIAYCGQCYAAKFGAAQDDILGTGRKIRF